MRQLADGLYLHEGSANTGILLDERRRALLIDAGGPGVLASLRALGAGPPERVLCTHHHPEQVWGLPGAPLVVPEGERRLFEAPEEFWTDPLQRWHVYHFRPQPWVHARACRVVGTCRGGDVIHWGDALVRVVDTPGHTDGSVSYVVETGGHRLAFTGDCIAGPGQVWDLYSLQKGRSGLMDYHGFLGDRQRLLEGLHRVLALRPEALIPSHGAPIREPWAAVAALGTGLEALWASYGRVCAGRHYFPQVFADLDGRAPHLPAVPVTPLPRFVRHHGTTFVLTSADGAVLVLDCGDPSMVERLEGHSVEGLWLSHYHDDHVDGAAAFRRAFACPVLADARLAEVLEDPWRFRLPCQCPTPLPVDRRLADGERWQWHEFALTSFRFPGQTLYHAALLVEGHGERLLFAGDAFTPTGLDDYCAFNRNLMAPGAGYAECLARLRALEPVTLFNCHVDVGFSFTREHLDFLEAALEERRGILRRLLPWPDPDFGLDPDWVRLDPYEQATSPGARVHLDVVVTNHALAPVEARAQLLPAEDCWHVAPEEAATVVAAKGEGCLPFEVAVPPEAPRGRHVVAARLHLRGRDLGPLRAGVVEVRAAEA